jgi:hypothetical protein
VAMPLVSIRHWSHYPLGAYLLSRNEDTAEFN